MPTYNSSKSLEKVTRLYLSKGRSAAQGEVGSQGGTEAIVWLASSGNSFNRAFVSVGLAESFSRMGLNVTLVETSPSLPNIGYYLSLEPEDYLLGTLEPDHVCIGSWSPNLQYAFGADTSLFLRSIDRFVPQKSPHLVFLSFPIRSDTPDQGFLFELRKLGRDLLNNKEYGNLGIPDLIFVVGERVGDRACNLFIDEARRTFQDPLIHQAVLSSNVVSDFSSDKYIQLSSEVFYGSHKRVPAGIDDFERITTNILELISLKRRKEDSERARS